MKKIFFAFLIIFCFFGLLSIFLSNRVFAQHEQVCTPYGTLCVSTSECPSGCKACNSTGTGWYCTNSSWCDWCSSNTTPTQSQPTPTPTTCLKPPPPSGLTGSCSASGNSATVSWNSAPRATSYALRINDTSNGWTGTCDRVNPGDVCNNDLRSTSYNFTTSPGRYFDVWVHSINNCGWSGATNSSFSCPCPTPPPPSGLTGSCSASGNSATISWNSVPGANSYVLRIDDTSNGWTGRCDQVNDGDACIDYHTSTSYTFSTTPGHSYSWWIHSINSCGLGNATNSSFSCSALTPTLTPTPTPTSTPTPTPTPTLYPTVAIYGTLKEYSGNNSCGSSVSSSPLSIQVKLQNSQGITSNCGITPAPYPPQSSYRCTLSFDNQTYQPTPAQTVNLSVISSYSSAYWTENNQCTDQASNSLSFNVASNPPNNLFPKDIFFQANYPWIKLKNASFNKYQGSLNNRIPNNVTAYDFDDNNTRQFIVGSAGLVAAYNVNLNGAPVSTVNWQINNYTPQKEFTYQLFNNYIKARKEYQVINNLSSISENKINIFNNDLSIDGNNKSLFDNKKIVLIVEGVVNIEVDNPFSPSSSVAIFANSITFSPGVREAYGIFIANTVDTGSTNDQGLKINGNLIALSALNNNRRWQNASKPSLFIVFDPSVYLNLLDKLMITKYDWQQTQ